MPGRDDSIVPMAEAALTMEVFATGLAQVEYCGDYVRLTFCRTDFGALRVWLPTECYRDCVLTLLDAPSRVAH